MLKSGGKGARLAGYEASAEAAVRQRKVPGAVAMVADGGEVLHQSAFGRSNRPDGREHTLDDVFMLASMTKIVTAVAGAQLLERGLFALDQPAEDILPEIANHQVITGFDANDRPLLRAAKSKPTIRQLFTHTSGHSSDVWNANTLKFAKVMGLPPIPSCKVAAFDLPLAFDPGTGWEYGVATDFLGKIIEKLSGMRLEQYFKTQIFDRVGMDWTSFVMDERQLAELVPVRGKSETGEITVLDFQISQTPEMYMAGAGLYGTAGDYLKFLQMLLNKGEASHGRVLKPETVALMFQNHIGDLSLPVMKTVIPPVSADLALDNPVGSKWSLCAHTNLADIPGRRKAGSQFWGGLGSSYYWVDPTSNLAGLIMLSYFPFADRAGLDLFETLERESYSTFADA
ncbi:MAG TPA: serine hydrolase domain-containing protein [Devosia sp.]|nr:serine hydrolase domain-containing protein [Devosia sp.]